MIRINLLRKRGKKSTLKQVPGKSKTSFFTRLLDAYCGWRYKLQTAKGEKVLVRALARKAKVEARAAKLKTEAEAKALGVRNKAETNVLKAKAKAEVKARLIEAEDKSYLLRRKIKRKERTAKAYSKALRLVALKNGEKVDMDWKLLFIPLLCLLVCIILTLAGIVFKIDSLWTLCLWLSVLSARFFSFVRSGKFYTKGIYKMLLPRLSTLYLGIWITITISRLTGGHR